MALADALAQVLHVGVAAAPVPATPVPAAGEPPTPAAAAEDTPAQAFQSALLPPIALVGLTPFELGDPDALDHETHVLDGSTFFEVEDASTLDQLVGLLP